MTEKLDLQRELKEFYRPAARAPQFVILPPLKYLMIEGRLQPGERPGESEQFARATEALYGLAYTIKFMSKLRESSPVDFKVMGLEGQWWVESGKFGLDPNEPWCFNLMIMQPEHITPEMFRAAADELRKKKGELPALAKMRLEEFTEGACVQMMHIGPYSDEERTFSRMHDFAIENGYEFSGKHHEIYMGDPRRTAPDKLKTILRMPVRKST